MGWAIRNDGLGWRAVNSSNDCTANETFSETEPPPVDIVSIKTQFTPNEFIELFPEQEQLAVVEATMTVAPIKLWYDKMIGSSFVDLNDPRTPAGLSALVAAGLIPQARYDVIMGLLTT